MSTKLPTISVTTEKHLSSESSDTSDDSNSNDMDYNRNNGGATDVEDFDSQADDNDKPRSRKSSSNVLGLSKAIHVENDVTDVEDYNDSDSEEEKSNVYPELIMSLEEFLRHGLQEQAMSNDEMNEKMETMPGNFLKAQNLNGLSDYLTDCDDYSTDSELEYDNEKSVCVDLDTAIDDPGQVCIADVSRPTKTTDQDSEEDYEEVSVLSDVSDLASALSEVALSGVGRGMSEDELLEISGSEEICQIACSGSSSEGEEDYVYQGASNASLFAIDVTFIGANGQQRRNSTSTNKINFLEVNAINDEVLTDIERLDDSAAEEDSFDDEEDPDEPIPRAVILAPGDDGTCVTDTEDIFCDDPSSSTVSTEIREVTTEALPPPHREVVELKEDKFGDTITNVMPMDNDYKFGFYNNIQNDATTDSEDYSCAEEYERRPSIADELLACSHLIEGCVTVANEVLKPQLNKRAELHSNAESVTDVEEIYVAGTNRRKKVKTRSMSKGKSKLFLDIVKGKEEGTTDVEDLDLSECCLSSNVKGVTSDQQMKSTNTSDKVTDIEDLTADEVSDVSDSDVPLIAADNASLMEYHANRSNAVHNLEKDVTKKCSKQIKRTKHHQLFEFKILKDDGHIQQNVTDIEDIQLASDVEEVCKVVKEERDCTCNELNDMLNESYTVVHEKSSSSFDVDAEKLHIKGMPELRDAHTDVEYVESDESVARESIQETTHDIIQNRQLSVDSSNQNIGGDIKHAHYDDDKNNVEKPDDTDKSSPKNDHSYDVDATIRKEAIILVDKVLEESVNIISGQQSEEQQNGSIDSIKHEYNSDSDNYAITCDDVGGLEVIKSPTIESMSGKSFDDNMSFTDEHTHLPIHSEIIPTTTSTSTNIQKQQQIHHQQQHSLICGVSEPTSVHMTTSSTTLLTTTTITTGVGSDATISKLKDTIVIADVSNDIQDLSDVKTRRIDHKFEKLSASSVNIDEEAAKFDEHFDAVVHEDEISNLQGDFSKMSWDDSVSPTTNTLGDFGQNTPDNEIQDIATETGGDFEKSTDTTPVPPSMSTTTITTTTSSHDLQPTPKPRLVKPTSPGNETDGTIQSLMPEDFSEKLTLETQIEISTPVPKPRSQMKQSDSYKNLAALAEQSDSVSLRSLDFTEELSKTEEPSTEFSGRSQLRDFPTTTTTTASEDHTGSFEPTSEISVDDADTEISESDECKATSFYIGESSRNIIIKTTPTRSTSELAVVEDGATSTTIEVKDIPLMREISIDSDSESGGDVFKEYVTMKRGTGEADMKLIRQDSETRNDLLEQETDLLAEIKEEKLLAIEHDAITMNESINKYITDQSNTIATITSTASTTSGAASLEVAHSTGDDDSIKELSELMKMNDVKTFDTVVTETIVTTKFESIRDAESEKLDLPLEKSEFEISEKEEMPQSKSKVVHSPQQIHVVYPIEVIDEAMVVKTLEEVQESLDAAKLELKFVVKDGKTIKESPSEFEFRSITQSFTRPEAKESLPAKADAYKEIESDTGDNFASAASVSEEGDISSFIGIPEVHDKTETQQTATEFKQNEEDLFEGSIKESLNKEVVSAHYSQDVFGAVQRSVTCGDDHGSLGFISTGTAEDFSSMEEHAANEEHASLGFISTETAEDFSSMEDYLEEKMVKANVLLTEQPVSVQTSTQQPLISATTDETFGEISSEQTMKPFDIVIHRVKAESTADTTINRWSVPEIADHSSSSESYYRSFEKSESRPLSSDVENLLTQANSSDYQTAMDASSVYRETTEYVSAVSSFDSSSGKTISSHESMKSLDSSQSITSGNLGSIDVSELSETLVASSTEADALEAEELAAMLDLADDDDSDESLEIPPMTEQQIQQSMMKRSQEMIFKPKVDDAIIEEKKIEFVKIEEFPQPKEVEKNWGLAYPIAEGVVDDIKESERAEDILLYHGDMRRSIDESKLASSLDEGSILSVSMSSTSNIDTVVENFEDMIGSAGSSSLTGIEGFGFSIDEPISSYPEETTFVLEMGSKEQSPQELAVTISPDDTRKRGHKRNESTSITGDELKNLTEKELPVVGENKESESESDTDPYESEYSRQFRSPNERKKKKKQSAAEMDHSFETEKRPFTPSQLVAEVIVEDSVTEELEAKEAIMEERRPSQNMQDYSNIPDIMVTEDTPKSPGFEDEEHTFREKTLYKVKTQEELNKAADVPLYQASSTSSTDAKEENFQKLVQEQYQQKLAELQRAQVGADSDDDDHRAPDSPDSFEMVEQPDISDEFVIIEEVAKEANEVDMGGKSIKIQPTKYESKHDEEVENIVIKSAPADPKLGSQLYRDDLNFEFEESPPTVGSGSEQQDDSDSGETAAANKRWVEMQLTDQQMRYPYDITGGVLEDIKEEDGEFEVGSSRISSFKDSSFSSTPDYDVMAARRYFSRGEHDDVSMSSLQEFESLEQAISLENRNRTHQGSTDSSNGSFQRRYMVRHSGSGTAQGDDISVSSLKEFEGLENACIEAHLIEIKAKEEAALLSRSDESNKSNKSNNGSERESNGVVIGVSKVTRTTTRTEVQQQPQNIGEVLKQKLEECESKGSATTVRLREITSADTFESSKTTKTDKQDSEKGSVDSLEINKSLDVMTSSIDSFDISKDATTRSDIDSLEVDRKSPTREESFESIENEQMDFITKFVSGDTTTLNDGQTTTTTTTTTSTDADGREQTLTRIVTTTLVSADDSSGIPDSLELPLESMTKDISVDSLNLCIEQTTSSAGTTATYQSSAGNSQMSGSVTSCASSTLMEDSYPTAVTMTSSTYWTHEESSGVVGAETQRLSLEDADMEALKQQRHEQHQHRP